MKVKQIPLLDADDIEVRIQQACKGNKALALLYKTSRTDMRILDDVFGIDGWKDDYKEIRGNLYCGISIYDEDKHEWITKWDCGIESQQEDGNEKKAEASDAFKRAGTKIGIGRELYTSPQIFLNAETKENTNGRAKYALVHPYEKYCVSEIAYDEKKREIVKLVIIDSKNNVVYSFGTNVKPSAEKTKPQSDSSERSQNASNAPQSTKGMTLEQALNFSLKSGKHANQAFKDVPSGYLQWLVDKGSGVAREAAQTVLEQRDLESAKKYDDDLPF